MTPRRGFGEKAGALIGLASAPRFPVAGFENAANGIAVGGVSLISTGET